MSLNKAVDEYISKFDSEIQKKLQRLRKIVKEIAPDSQEGIFYGMPGYKLNGPLAYFAAFKNHIGFYPIPATIEEFAKDLSDYKTSKGGIQFPNNKPIPYDLVERMVRYRLKVNNENPTKYK